MIVLDAATLCVEDANPAALRARGHEHDGDTGPLKVRFDALPPELGAEGLEAAPHPLRNRPSLAVTLETTARRRDGSTCALSLTMRLMAGGARIAALAGG